VEGIGENGDDDEGVEWRGSESARHAGQLEELRRVVRRSCVAERETDMVVVSGK
jgi:hypothetical protein